MGCPYKKLSKFFKIWCLPRFHFGLLASLHSRIIFATKPLATDYLLLPVVLPWATFGYLLSYGRCRPKVAQPLVTFCSSLGYLLFSSLKSFLMGCPHKNVKTFQSLMFSSISCRLYLPRLYLEISSFTKFMATGLPIVSYCLTMGYLWLPIVIWQM